MTLATFGSRFVIVNIHYFKLYLIIDFSDKLILLLFYLDLSSKLYVNELG